MKYKEAGNGEYITIFSDTERTASWNKKNKPGYYAEMMAWVAEGNEIEPQYTAEELAAKEEADATQAIKSKESELLNLIKDNAYHTTEHTPESGRRFAGQWLDWDKKIKEWEAQLLEVKSGKLVEIAAKPVF